ncbi:MAG TPA: transporter [Pyrinomonadaceae bacterium]|nr:transporter [Pyrinomonadaceae bacterium]
MIDSSPTRHLLRNLIFALLLLLISVSNATAQSPFVTDDVDTTPKGHFHFAFLNEFDLLPHTDLPAVRQNEADVEFEYGLFDRIEVGVESPLITIMNTRDTVPRNLSGLGDTNLSVKYNFLKHPDKTRIPALALVFNLELPTGDTNRELGSGLADFYVNGILESSITKRTTFRLNGGILFSGNQSTGVEGIRTRGRVFTASGSFVREFTPKLQLGVELFGAVEKNFELGKGQLAAQFGGNYQFRKNASFDFGVVAGKFVASPRFGAKAGISIDW